MVRDQAIPYTFKEVYNIRESVIDAVMNQFNSASRDPELLASLTSVLQHGNLEKNAKLVFNSYYWGGYCGK